jgi:hypothetical protein
VCAQHTQRLIASRLACQELERAVEIHSQYVVFGLERSESGALLNVRTEAADAGPDGLAGVRVVAQRARQRQQRQRRL